MATTKQELDSFVQYAQRRVSSGEEATLDELFDQWRQEHPSDQTHAENVAAIAASIEDFKKGERGVAAGQHSAQLRDEFGLTDR